MICVKQTKCGKNAKQGVEILPMLCYDSNMSVCAESTHLSKSINIEEELFMRMKRIPALLLSLALLMGLSALPAYAEDYHVSISALEYKTVGGKVTITDCSEGARGVLEIPATLDGCPVTSINNGAFEDCDQITSVTIPNTVVSLGEYAFADCKSLGGVIVPDSVTKMGMCTFSGCTSLQSIRIGSGVKELPFKMCAECTSLSSVELPYGLEKIGGDTFESCSGLKSVTLPGTLKEIGSGAFYKSGLESVVIPDSVETINQSFFWAENLKSVTLGSGLKQIKGYAFSHTALESVVIPDNVQSLGEAFMDCKSLKTATVGSGLKELQKHVFNDCSSLETVIIRDGLQSIGTKQAYSAQVPFSGCESLKTIYLPGSLYEIGRFTFKDCTQLTDIYYGGTAYGWGGMAIAKDNDPILNAKVHYIPFQDVMAGDYYYDPMVWAIDRGITNGTSDTTFSPGDACIQAQILTFLHRAAGSPSVSGGSPYTNDKVDPSQYYYNAMLWAFQQGIVTDKDLDPNAGCSRSDVVLYLWRLNSRPSASGTGFIDVPASAPYAQAVAWAVKQGITNGTSDTEFSPDQTCTRAQIVTFLYRAFA